ncbi:MAG: DUF4124 domain-containing protein [Desulfobacterales bacterium]
MNVLNCLAVLGVLLAGTAATGAEIYHWIDQQGVHRYSNQPPPAGVPIIERMDEHRYDPEADRKRRERDAVEWEQFRQRQEKERREAETREQEQQLQEAIEKQRAQEKKIEALEKKVDQLQKEQKRTRIIILPQSPVQPTPLPGATVSP